MRSRGRPAGVCAGAAFRAPERGLGAHTRGVSDREMVIHVPDHSLSLSRVDDAVVDAFLDWFRRAGPDEVYEVASGEEALEVLDELQPQLVLVDVRMPGMGGIEAARRISESFPGMVVALISIEDPIDLPSTAQASGAVAFVRKQDFGANLLRELWAAHGRT